MKNATVLVNENVSIENAHGLMKLIFERYQPEEIRELLNEIIYQYNWLLMEHLRDQGAAKGLIDEVNSHTHLLKELSDALKGCKVLS